MAIVFGTRKAALGRLGALLLSCILLPAAAHAQDEQQTDDIGAIVRDADPAETSPKARRDRQESAELNRFVKAFLKAEFDAAIENVVVRQDELLIDGRLPDDGNSYMLAEVLLPSSLYDGGGPNVIMPLQREAEAGRFSVTLPRASDTGIDRLYSRWIILRNTERGTALSSQPRWATDVSDLAIYNVDETRAASIKGTDDFYPSSYEATAAIENNSHIKLNVRLDNLLSMQRTEVRHRFNGETYYISPGQLTKLDRDIAAARRIGARVGAVLLIGRSKSGPRSIIEHPDAALGVYAMANTTSIEGVNHYAAVMDFLAERYTKPTDNGAGRIDYWIVHNEVDAHRAWTHAGFKPVELYTDIYVKSMRIAYYTIRKYDPVGRVYASFTHHWNSRAQKSHPDNFKPRDILATMVKLSDQQGDFEWGIGFHPYPEDLRDPTTWNDSLETASFDDDTVYITPRNVEMIDAYVRRRDVLYNDARVRPIIFSEQGITSNPRGNPNANIQTQAAGVAYFWKKSARLPSLEAIHYHRLIDHPREGNLRFGLYYEKERLTREPGDRKPSFYVWDAAGTPREAEVFDQYLPLTGLSDWSDHFVDMPTDTTPHHITLHLDLPETSTSQNAFVSFNGQRRRVLPGGTMNFFNVASNTAQPFSITLDGRDYVAAPLNIAADCQLHVSLGETGNVVTRLSGSELCQ